MIPVLLALLVQVQQPGRPPANQATPQAPSGAQPLHVETRGRELRTPFDTTVAAIRRVGLSVAEVKSGLEAFRRAANREPGGVVVERAAMLQGKCRAMARSASTEARVLCRDCVDGERRAALERYRAYLASLARVGNECAASIARQHQRGGTDRAAERLKREARAIGDRIIAGLVPYEQRLAVVRRAFGWASPGNTTRRGS